MKNGMIECSVCHSKIEAPNTRVVSRAYDQHRSKISSKFRVLNVLLVVGDCFLVGLQPILVYMSKVDGGFKFSPISVNFLTELAKVFFAIVMVLFQAKRQKVGEKPLLSVSSFIQAARNNVLLAVPGLLYAVNNYLKFIMQLYFNPATVKMLSNLKVLAGAELFRRLPGLQPGHREIGELGTEVEAMGGGDSNPSYCVSLEEESDESLLFDSKTKNTQKEALHANDGLDARSKWLLAFRAAESETLRLSRAKAFKEIMQSYDSLKVRSASLEEAKRKIISYKPGTWTEEVGGLKKDDYAIPETTTLLLVGLSRSGKSSLVNRISRVFEDKFTPERAQVSYNCVGDGTTFLHEYMIPRGSTSFCLYDTCGFYENCSDNIDMIRTWMTKGVRHGELVFRDPDYPSQGNFEKYEAWQTVCSRERRMVNFVIFVVNARSVLTFMDLEDVMERDENDLFEDDIIKECFRCSYLSCKDDKPVVVCTHGDLLSQVDRARVRIHLGELLGISPVKQIFDIPEDCDPETDLAVVDVLTYSLMHADKNFPVKSRSPYKLSGLGEILEDFFFGVDEDIEEDNSEDDEEMESSLVSTGAKKVTCSVLRPAIALQLVLGALMIALTLICTYLMFKLVVGRIIWNFWCSLKNSSQGTMNVESTPSADSAGIHINWQEIRHLWGA